MLLNYVLAFANDTPAVLREKVTWVYVETSCFFWTAWASTLRSRRPLLLVNEQGLWLMLVGLVALGVSDAFLSANEQIIPKYV